MCGPHSGKAICLQLQPNGGLVRASPRRSLLICVDLITDAQQILDVMSDFMSNDICLREIARRMKAIAQFLKETRVEINLFIREAVERPHRRLTKAARGFDSPSKKDQFWFAVSYAFASENIRPRIFCVTENGCDKVFGSFIGR